MGHREPSAHSSHSSSSTSSSLSTISPCNINRCRLGTNSNSNSNRENYMHRRSGHFSLRHQPSLRGSSKGLTSILGHNRAKEVENANMASRVSARVSSGKSGGL